MSLVFVFATVASAYTAPNASASQIVTRSLTLQPVGSVGGSAPGGVVNHAYQFTLPNVGTPDVGSIKFLYCTTAADPTGGSACVAPTGMSVTGAALGTQGGATGFSPTFGGTFSNNDATATSRVNGFYITRTAASVPLNTVASYLIQKRHQPDDRQRWCQQWNLLCSY